jgi:hypothetical protein
VEARSVSAWPTSPYSGTGGTDCVEASPWRTSSYSGPTGTECVEVSAWRTSSYSGTEGTDCVESRSAGGAVQVRDSKDRAGATLAFPPAVWRTFASRLKGHSVAGEPACQ